MSLQVLVIDTGSQTEASFLSQCNLAVGGLDSVQSLSTWLAAVPNQYAASITIKTGAVQAFALITSTGSAANNQTMTLCNKTLTAKTSSADPEFGEFNISATPATQAASIALAINTLPAFSGIVTAVAELGVVTVTSVVPGVIGNGLQIADVDLANVTVDEFVAGDNGTEYTIDFS